MIWYSHLLQSFPQFIVIHRVKGFGRVNKAEIDVFLEFSCFFDDPADVGNLISGSSAFSKSSLNIWKFTVHVCCTIASHFFINSKTDLKNKVCFLKSKGTDAFALIPWTEEPGRLQSMGSLWVRHD